MPDNTRTPPEPSMEEIIASISRIITEEKQPVVPIGVAPGDKTDILELTEVVDEDGSVRQVTAATGALNAPSGEAAAPPSPSAGNPAGHNRARTLSPDTGSEPRLDRSRERIVSSATSGAAAAAFKQLGALPRERRREGELALGSAERVLEGMMRDLLRPLLQAWLDEHLPDLVERLVRDEIARLVGDAGLR